MPNTTTRRHGPRPVLRLVAILLAATSCRADSGTAPEETDTLMPTLSSIQTHVFTPSCAGHHGPSLAEADLDLSAGRSFANLVNVPSIQVELSLVTPGDAENSYLIHKMDGRPGIVGGQMPIGRLPLDAEEIAVIRQWIDMGAPNN